MRKRLYRSTNDRLIAGVVGGLAEYFNIDPVVMRLIALLTMVLSGLSAIVVYFILWVVVPDHP